MVLTPVRGPHRPQSRPAAPPLVYRSPARWGAVQQTFYASFVVILLNHAANALAVERLAALHTLLAQRKSRS